ncbi:hypothetical protein ANN_11950 [Periplaneta americana]|uniref:DUF4817 domain-containing protein n=1 Tax=Periplaneta americana TaxID=6978 RepID=A0ABQ8T7V3_PERAM|nr:hypothetical protein ANN_11950 [Periplaneta americana]
METGSVARNNADVTQAMPRGDGRFGAAPAFPLRNRKCRQKMDVQRKVECVLWLVKFESVTRVRREFRTFNEESPYENNVRRWDRQTVKRHWKPIGEEAYRKTIDK